LITLYRCRSGLSNRQFSLSTVGRGRQC